MNTDVEITIATIVHIHGAGELRAEEVNEFLCRLLTRHGLTHGDKLHSKAIVDACGEDLVIDLLLLSHKELTAVIKEHQLQIVVRRAASLIHILCAILDDIFFNTRNILLGEPTLTVIPLCMAVLQI